MIKCGMSEIPITPPLGLSIPGYFENRLSSGIKDELYAKAMVLDDGKNAAAFICLDAVAVYADQVRIIRERVSENTGIPFESIMVSATHIHTGLPVANSFKCLRDDAYVAFMLKKAADAAIISFNKRKPVRIGFGSGREDSISFNRRFFMKDGTVRTNPGFGNPDMVRPAGPIDPEVAVIRIDDLDGVPVGVVINFACHPDVVGGTEYSGDYPGELSRMLKKTLGNEIVSIFFNGTCGNINHLNAAGGVKPEAGHHIKMGRILAGEVLKVREKIKVKEDLEVRSSMGSIKSATRIVTSEDVEKAHEILASQTAPQIEKIYANEILVYSESVRSDEIVELQVITVGELAVAGLPGEVFVELGLDIKGRSPFKHNMISTNANARFGYIPTPEAFEQGGYEPRTTRVNRLEPGAGSKMVETVLEMMQGLHK